MTALIVDILRPCGYAAVWSRRRLLPRLHRRRRRRRRNRRRRPIADVRDARRRGRRWHAWTLTPSHLARTPPRRVRAQRTTAGERRRRATAGYVTFGNRPGATSVGLHDCAIATGRNVRATPHESHRRAALADRIRWAGRGKIQFDQASRNLPCLAAHPSGDPWFSGDRGDALDRPVLPVPIG
ncbi:MAG: hypothetical protein QOE71_1151 [Pseudonocardiales bacterium]|nr:hypothetical protein [Pseudonocardiales bacterium]